MHLLLEYSILCTGVQTSRREDQICELYGAILTCLTNTNSMQAGDRGNILLEVQIQNAMPHTMHLDLVNFDPAAGLSCINCNTMSSCDR